MIGDPGYLAYTKGIVISPWRSIPDALLRTGRRAVGRAAGPAGDWAERTRIASDGTSHANFAVCICVGETSFSWLAAGPARDMSADLRGLAMAQRGS